MKELTIPSSTSALCPIINVSINLPVLTKSFIFNINILLL